MRTAPPIGQVAEQVQGWYLYRFDTDLICASGPTCPFDHPLYCGKSNDPTRRLLEHAKKQPWWPYVTGWSTDPEVYGSDAEVLRAERQAILIERPLANRQHNELNPCRLDFGTAVRAPGHVAMSQSLRHRPGRLRRSVRWIRRLPRAVLWLAAWLILAVTVTAYCAARAHIGLRDGLLLGVFGATGVLIGAARARKPRRRRRSRRRW